MDRLLINPNQYRKLDIQICDDLTSPHIKLIIEAYEDLYIPMPMEGYICGIFTLPPN